MIKSALIAGAEKLGEHGSKGCGYWFYSRSNSIAGHSWVRF